MDISGTECARARESVSADLDRELHELDRRRLRAHLRMCADCSAWAEGVKLTTTELREAPLEPYTTLLEMPRRRRAWRVAPAIAIAPAAALVASVVVALGGAQHASSDSRSATTTQNLRVGHSGPAVDMHGPAEQHRAFHAV